MNQDFAAMGMDLAGLDLGYSGDPLQASAAGIPAGFYSGDILAGDQADAAHMERWNPAADQGVPWWAGIATYGISKAIDNAFPGTPTGTRGNTYPGSGAGPGGRSYTQRPTNAGGGTVTARVGTPLGALRMQSSTWLLLALAATFVIMK